MATWSVTPSVPHTGNTFNFPENTGTTNKNYTITYVDDNNCSVSTTYTVPANAACQSTCEIVLTSKDGDFPCDEGEYSGWWFGYEIYTTVGGVRTKTDEGDDYGDVTLEENCDGSDRTIYYGSAEIAIDLSIIDDNPNCTVSGTFTQEGGSPSQKIITGCSQIAFADSGHFNNNPGSYTYNGHNGNITFDEIHPIFDGTWAAVKASRVHEFYCNAITPIPSGTSQNCFENWVAICDCCQEPITSVTGGTSGGSDSSHAWIANCYVNNVPTCHLSANDSSTSTLSVTDSRVNAITLDYDYSSTYYLDDQCNGRSGETQTPQGIGAILEFDIYRNQTTQTGETITCNFNLYIDLRTRQ